MPDKASWLTSFFIAGGLYTLFCSISPPDSTFVDKTVESLDDEMPFNEMAVRDPAGWEKEKGLSSPGDLGTL